MILFEKENLSLLQQNIIVIECEGIEEREGFVYLSRGTYNQALLLNDRFEGEIVTLKKHLKITRHEEAIDYYYNCMPEPVNILAAFLGLVGEEIMLDSDVELLTGVLHQMSCAIDFDMFTKVPYEVRADVYFSKSMVFGYKKSWEDIKLKINLAEVSQDTLSTEFVKTLVEEIINKCISQYPIQEGLLPVKQENNRRTQNRDKIEVTVPDIDGFSSEGYDPTLDSDSDLFDPWAHLEEYLADAEASVSKEEGKQTLVEEVPEVQSSKDEEKEKELSIYDKIAQMYGGGAYV